MRKREGREIERERERVQIPDRREDHVVEIEIEISSENPRVGHLG